MTTSTGESAEQIPTEDAITRLRKSFMPLLFSIDGLLERAKRIWATMHGDPERGPDPDFTPWDDERRILVNIIREQTKRAGGGNYNEAPKGTNAVVIGCTITLLCAFIIGAVVFSNEFSAVKAQVSEWQKATDRRLDVLERRP